ncbi:hypothetical protein QN355_13575 [Cryobacterium sp. 10S3]|uniref:hypothetical protein n=1 Tax=Cryobacterium sp. 10S3 TaxID=3048582 RepID=UPI002AC94DA4|nr:hypothetical protein [Cryobacterium sp. 10S3]MEB0287583.1 hypothetical protein [Cryobacterium sp. 10S3]WPX15386.1 hypothetical protein RHM57_08555 [Cryobacterium sp. 10S3]
MSGQRGFLSAETGTALAALAALDSAADPLDRVRGIRRLLLALDADPATLAAVRDALAAGTGWEAIAAAAGLKPPAARWRWSGSDSEIAARLEAGRKRSARPSSVPTELPGYSVAEAATRLGITVQAVYLRVSRGKLASQTIELPDGRSYKRVFLDAADDVPSPPDASGRAGRTT